MQKKELITHHLTEIKKDPERYKKLREFAISLLSEEQKKSEVFESLLDIKMRNILSKYT